jgi:nucleoside-diphosphate-sugar epimerase
MRVVLAGATGVIGQPLMRALRGNGHEVMALRRESAATAPAPDGVRWITADVLDRDALLRAVDGVSTDAVISQLTALKKPPLQHRDMRATDRLRTEGTENLIAVAQATGAERFVTQSMMFGYGYADRGAHRYRENEPFGPSGQGRFQPHVDAMRRNEQLVLSDPTLQGVALRYGLIYGGPASAELVDGVRRRRLPVLRNASPLSWTYLDDAVSATVAALESAASGAYNIADDVPVSWTELVTALADAIGAPPPRRVPPALVRLGAPYGFTVLRGGVCLSNEKAHQDFGWQPAVRSYRDGIARLTG